MDQAVRSPFTVEKLQVTIGPVDNVEAWKGGAQDPQEAVGGDVLEGGQCKRVEFQHDDRMETLEGADPALEDLQLRALDIDLDEVHMLEANALYIRVEAHALCVAELRPDHLDCHVRAFRHSEATCLEEWHVVEEHLTVVCRKNSLNRCDVRCPIGFHVGLEMAKHPRVRLRLRCGKPERWLHRLPRPPLGRC